MKKMFEKGSDEWKFFVDYYKFIQDYALPEQSDTFWDDLFHTADSLCKKYNNTYRKHSRDNRYNTHYEQCHKWQV